MIPAFPMDGGRVLRALLSYKLDRVKATRIAASIGQVLALGFIVLGFYGNPFLAFIGVFIFLGAQAEARQVKSRALISGVRLRDVMMRDIPLLDSKLTIRDAAQQLLAGQNKTFVVMNEGKARWNTKPFGNC
jgi:hypothetical protein